MSQQLFIRKKIQYFTKNTNGSQKGAWSYYELFMTNTQ